MTEQRWALRAGDCGETLDRLFVDESIDSIVTDPPYGLSKRPDMVDVLQHWLGGEDYEHTGSGFMGKAWDSFVPGPAMWGKAYRVLKPGGHCLVFGGTRTFDMVSIAIRLAGFEVRDTLMWMHGEGFPKSLDVAKSIAKADPGDDRAADWDGWGTALKPAWEPIIVARKPLRGTVAANVLEHGTGALNIDACRIGAGSTPGRWPANVLLDHHEDCQQVDERSEPVAAAASWECVDGCPVRLLDEQSGVLTSGKPSGVRGVSKHNVAYADVAVGSRLTGFGDSGGASRFFYQSKAAKSERNLGLPEGATNDHPTVKPVAVMGWLARLVTPLDGVVLDPFCGSGTTGAAALRSGFRFIGLDLSDDYLDRIATPRLRLAQEEWENEAHGGLF